MNEKVNRNFKDRLFSYDVSFILDSTMSLYEQQSTYNPNMPVRQLIYLGRLYEKYITGEKLNIYGRKPCRPLEEYTWLVEKIRENLKTVEIEEAVDQALRAMPESFGIRKYLISNRAEVKDMLLTKYDEAKYMEMFKEEGREEGRAEGKMAVLISLVQSGDLRAEKAAEKLGITVEEFEKMMKDTSEK